MPVFFPYVKSINILITQPILTFFQKKKNVAQDWTFQVLCCMETFSVSSYINGKSDGVAYNVSFNLEGRIMTLLRYLVFFFFLHKPLMICKDKLSKNECVQCSKQYSKGKIYAAHHEWSITHELIWCWSYSKCVPNWRILKV